jgi:hypothetical protein
MWYLWFCLRTIKNYNYRFVKQLKIIGIKKVIPMYKFFYREIKKIFMDKKNLKMLINVQSIN